jgi:hypothetical protein
MTLSIDRAHWTSRARSAAIACMEEAARMAGGVGAALGVGALACVACCAIPVVLGGVGLGSAALAAGALAAVVEPWVGIATGALVLGAIAFSLAVRRARGPDPGTLGDVSCSASGPGCGCGTLPTSSVYESPQPRAGEPIVCTAGIDKPSVAEQLDGYRAAFAHLTSRERFDGGFRWRFRGGEDLEAQLRQLAEREHACCRFFAFHLVRDGSDVVWETRADERAAGVLDEFFRLPEQLGAGATGATPDLASTYRRAGLSFAADPIPARDRG